MTDLNPDFGQIAGRLLRNMRLPAELRHDLAEALRQGAPRRVLPSETLIEEGSTGDVLHLVCRGPVDIHVTNIEGDRMKVASLQSPVMVGYLAVLDGGIRTASCTAAQASLVIDFSKAVVRTFLEGTDRGSQAFRVLLLRAMTTQLASTSRQLSNLSA